MIYSLAYQDLKLSAKRILEYFLLQQYWVNTNPSNRSPKWTLEFRDDIQLKYSTFNKPPFKMHNQSITRGIDSLLEHGFIEVSSQGGLCRGSVSEFKNTTAWKDWEPGEKIFNRQPFFSRGFTKDGL